MLETMLEALFAGLGLIFQWHVLAYFALGCVIGHRRRVRGGRTADTRRGLVLGVRDALQHWWLVIRCSVIGAYIGMLPGLGASIVGWVTYGHAMQGARDPSQFGQGGVRGVLAPEAANNALRGGALIPGHMVVPGVLLFVYIGAWLGGASVGDWVRCTFFGFLGFFMKRGGGGRGAKPGHFAAFLRDSLAALRLGRILIPGMAATGATVPAADIHSRRGAGLRRGGPGPLAPAGGEEGGGCVERYMEEGRRGCLARPLVAVGVSRSPTVRNSRLGACAVETRMR